MVGGINHIQSQLSSVYKENAKLLSDALSRIASGKNFQTADQNLLGFAKVQKLKIEIANYEQTRNDLVNAKVIISAAVEAGTTLYKNLNELKRYTQKYIDELNDGNDSRILQQYKSEFNTLKDSIVATLENSYTDGVLVTASGSNLQSVKLDPSGTSLLNISFTTNADSIAIDTFDISSFSDTLTIQNEIDRSLVYLSESKSYNAIVDHAINLTNTVISSKEAVKSLIVDIDDAKEVNNAVDLSIRNEAAIAMFAQGNVVQKAVSKLYDQEE